MGRVGRDIQGTQDKPLVGILGIKGGLKRTSQTKAFFRAPVFLKLRTACRQIARRQYCQVFFSGALCRVILFFLGPRSSFLFLIAFSIINPAFFPCSVVVPLVSTVLHSFLSEVS